MNRSHFFMGRYENIYIERHLITELDKVLDFAVNSAKQYLHRHTDLHVGFWFNYMLPGHVTLPHTHDDDDELASGVYYLNVPKHSGNFILQINNNEHTVQAEEGKLVLFSPDYLHKVTTHHSQDFRLSTGMNFANPEQGK